MLKDLKKWLTTSIVILLATALVIGCSGNANNGVSEGGKTPAEPDAANQGDIDPNSPWSVPVVDGRYTETVPLSALRVTPADVKYVPGESENDNYYIKWMKKQFNIDLTYPWTTTKQDTFNSKLSLMLASGEKMPDIVVAKGDIVNDLIDSGKFMEVGTMFDELANDIWKEAIDQATNAWLPFSRDGKRYALPSLVDAYQQDDVLWIRQDWLDKLGLQVPTTLAEMEEVMDAFVNQDPDGNGQKDTIGLAIGIKDGFVSYMSDTAPLWGAHGTMVGQWNLAEDGSLEYGSITQGARDTLEMLARWYEKGYLPTEAALYDINKATESIVNGKAGMIFGAHWLAEWPLGDVVKNDPEANFQPIPIPAGPDGKKGFREGSAVNGAILISKESKHPDAFFLYNNWLYERYPTRQDPFDTKAVDPNAPKGIYDLYQEKHIECDGCANPDKLSITTNFVVIPNLRMQHYAALLEGKEPTDDFMEQLSRKPEGNKKAASIILSEKEYGMPDMFQGTPTQTMIERKVFLDKLELETFTKIIYGEEPISAFDKFVEQWKSSGGDDITNEVNEWYRNSSGN